MSQDKLVKLKSTSSKHIRWSRRNKKTSAEKLELKKYDPTTRKVAVYKEMKK